MKRLLMLLLALMLWGSALAEETAAPVEIVEPVQEQITLEDAIAKARKLLRVDTEQQQIRANLVRMSDDTYRWVVVVFDMTTLTDGWCVELDASSNTVLAYHTTYDGFFTRPLAYWAAHKGGCTDKRLWRMEEKALFDALYALTPVYGLPQEGDMSREEAAELAALALEPYYPADKASGYLICPGYLMGGEGANGIWEIYFKGKDMIYQVNVDAVTGEILCIEFDDNDN